ncbi:hypothetical protein QBC42DRAFT_255947 [Cladorrhinum samala]|uniref:Uncharacterized protein n=1 Tax=Cladorrhinum samala TaxID=585594 RepID=A0AAV9HAP1_9PEZI|nr:hypothetical protein QBC42DRAFT_255947 [Cladorrhinum samala]
MAGKLIILAGAPESSKLDWDTAGLLNEFQESVARLAGININSPEPSPNHRAQDVAVWRSLSPNKEQVHTSLTQQSASFAFYGGPSGSIASTAPDFFTTDMVSFNPSPDDDEHNPILSQFYEQSMAIHQEAPSSQLLLDSGVSDQAESFVTDASTSFLSDKASQQSSVKEPLAFRGGSNHTDLKEIPSIAHLERISPQTMSVNIIAGIISISQPRMITTRWGAKHLVEVLVGDETKAGFAITYWLPADDVSKSPLAGLRPGDIVLMQNVGLSVFMKKVYGSSLRKDLTKVNLLFRMKLDARDMGGYYSTSDLGSSVRRSSRRRLQHPTPKQPNLQLEKTRRVREWVLNFVGHGNPAAKAQRAGHCNEPNHRRRWEQPPDDDSQMQ